MPWTPLQDDHTYTTLVDEATDDTPDALVVGGIYRCTTDWDPIGAPIEFVIVSSDILEDDPARPRKVSVVYNQTIPRTRRTGRPMICTFQFTYEMFARAKGKRVRVGFLKNRASRTGSGSGVVADDAFPTEE